MAKTEDKKEEEVWCDKIINEPEERHQCFRKKCFREMYDYNARSIIKTRLPLKFRITNYYAIPRRTQTTEAYEAILKSYYRWLKFTELKDDLFGYVDHFATGSYLCAATFGGYIAIATGFNIYIYENVEKKKEPISIDVSSQVKEIKFGFYTENDDSNHLYLVASFEYESLKAWSIYFDHDGKKKSNAKLIDISELTKVSPAEYRNFCSGTAKNFYSSNKLQINNYKIENRKMTIRNSISLSEDKLAKGSEHRPAKESTIISEEIVVLDSNDINIYAVTCRVDKNSETEKKILYLKRFVCEDVFLICNEGEIACDRKYRYAPLPDEFTPETKVYLVMEDLVICTCGKYIAVYDDPITQWIVSELIDDDHYVETLIVHVNLLLVGFNNGEIHGYDVSVTQSMVKPNFFNGARFRISKITDPIVAFNVLEHKYNETDLASKGIESGDQRKDVYYPFILITSTKNTYTFKFTNEDYVEHYKNSDKKFPIVPRSDNHKDDTYSPIDISKQTIYE